MWYLSYLLESLTWQDYQDKRKERQADNERADSTAPLEFQSLHCSSIL